MKNSMFTLVGFTLLILVSCNNIDTAVVDKIQASQTKIQESKTGIDAAVQDVANLEEQMSQAPLELRHATTLGYATLASKVSAFGQKYASMQAVQTDLNTKIETLMGDYVDGKIKKEAVDSQQEALIKELEGVQSQIERMAPMFNEISAEYAKMTATWQALPEAEQKALSANPDGTAPTPTGIIIGPTPATSPQPATGKTPGTLADPQPAKKQ